jgi:hypothetical protein
MDLDQVAALLTGQLVIYVESIGFESTPTDPEIRIGLLADVGDNGAEVEKLLGMVESKTTDDDEDNVTASHEIREFRGVDLHVETSSESDETVDDHGWAVVDGVLAIGAPVSTLERAVGGLLDGGIDAPLSAGTGFSTLSSATLAADGWCFVDIEPLAPLLEAAIDTGVETAAAAGNPFPIEPSALMSALGIDAMQAIFATFDLDEQIFDMSFGLTYTDNRGLMKLFAYGPKPAGRPVYVPPDSDSFTAASFDFTAAWEALVDIVNGINPALMGLAAMQLTSMTQEAGVELDLESDLLDNLTGEVTTIQNMGAITGATLAELEIEQSQVFVLGIDDPDAIRRVIAAATQLAGGDTELFNEREVDGRTIQTFATPPIDDETPANQFAYTVADDHLVLSMGEPSLMESTLGRLESTRGSVWKSKRVSRALGHLPSESAAAQFQDLAAIGDLVFRGLAIAERSDLDADREVRICDPSAVPPEGTVARYLDAGVSGVWKTDRSILVRALVLPAGGK